MQEGHLALFPISPTRVQQKREKREELKEIPSSSSSSRPVVVVGNPIGMPPPFPPLLPSGGLTTHDDSMWHGKEREREKKGKHDLHGFRKKSGGNGERCIEV